MARFESAEDLPHPGGIDLAGVDFDDDGAQRVLLVLAVDTSKSTEGAAIDSLNEGLKRLVEYLGRDKNLRSTASVALITFGHNGVVSWHGDRQARPGESPFVPVHELAVPTLVAGGVTPMVEAVQHAIYWISKEKQSLRSRGLQYYRPFLWLLTDGLPTDSRGHVSDEWKPLARTLQENVNQKHILFAAVGAANISSDGYEVLTKLSPRGHVKLDNMDYAKLLRLVSSSASRFASGQNLTDDRAEDEFYEALQGFRQISVDY